MLAAVPDLNCFCKTKSLALEGAMMISEWEMLCLALTALEKTNLSGLG